jgi:serine/threonine protein phosphatase PrpC
MDTNSVENAFNPNDSEATYRALRDSILQIYQFGTKIAKEANPDNELQVSWELGDTSLMNWISDTHCYLSSKGQKLQFLARPSKLEIISFNLNEGDKLLICSDSLRQNLSDNEIDEILQESHGSENSCQNLLKIANVNYGVNDNTHNIVVMEVINNQKVISPTPIADTKKASKG